MQKILNYFEHKGHDGEGHICQGTENFTDPLYLIKCKKCKEYDITFEQWENWNNKCHICDNHYCRECKEIFCDWCESCEKCVCDNCINDNAICEICKGRKNKQENINKQEKCHHVEYKLDCENIVL
jgi:hypothetical protein